MGIMNTHFGASFIKNKPKKKIGLIINNGAITTNKMKDNTVTTYKIVDKAVTEPKLADNSVSERTIQMSAVSHDKLAIGAVDKENIMDNAVTTRAIDKQAVTNDKLSVGAVGSENIMAYAVKEEQIAANAVTEEKIAVGAVSTEEIQDGCITFEKLSPDLLKRLLEEVATVKVDGQVVFMHNYTGKELPVPTSAGLYAYSNNNLYKSDGVGTYTWNRSASEAGKIYVDEDSAQSYISDGHDNLIRLDKENSDLSFEVID